MAKKAEKPRMGRPPLPADQRKRSSMAFRPKPELRKNLENAVTESKLSLSQEVERRLEWSFSDHDARLQGFGSKGRLKFLRALARAVDMVELTTGKDAFTDPITAEGAYELMTEMLDVAFSVRPGGPIDKVSPTEGQEAIIKHPAARTSVQNLRDVLMESVLPELPGALAAYRKKSRARRKGGR